MTQAPLTDPVRFPSGLKYLTDELHAMGFKGAPARRPSEDVSYF